MRKTIKMILALATVMSMSTIAFATETVGQNGSQNIDVIAKYSDTVTTPDVYSVDIEWEDMTFTYSEAGTMDWNPSTHAYTENVISGWDKESAEVTVTNHSNVAVDVTFAHAPITTYGVTTALSNTDSAVNLAAGVEHDVAGAASTTATLTVSGVPNEDVTETGIVVGTINVKIA